MTTNPPETHAFDRLINWATLDDVELQALFSDQNASLLHEIMSLLGDEDERNLPVVKSTFVTVVRKMRKRYKDGSRLLSMAIITGSELRDSGKIEEAKHIFERFLSACPSEFYRDIARYYLSELVRGNSGGRHRINW